MKLSFASRGKFMLIIWPFKLSELRRPILKDQAFEPEEKRFKLDKAITPTKHHSNWEILNSFNYTELYDWWSFHLLYFAHCIKYFYCESILSQIYYASLLYILTSLCCRWQTSNDMNVAQLRDYFVQSLREGYFNSCKADYENHYIGQSRSDRVPLGGIPQAGPDLADERP